MREILVLAMTSSTVRTSVRPPIHVCQCDQYHTIVYSIHLDIGLPCYDQLTPVNQGICCPVSRDHTAGSSLEPIVVRFFLS